MNTAIQAPTSNIRFKIDDKRNMFLSVEKGTESIWSDSRVKPGVDFYKILGDDCFENTKTVESCSSNYFQANMDFLILTLKNDLRVKSFRYTDKALLISFWNTQESISFYKQYFSIAEMKFYEGFEGRDFLGFQGDEEQHSKSESALDFLSKLAERSFHDSDEMNHDDSQIEFLDHMNLEKEGHSLKENHQRISKQPSLSSDHFLNQYSTLDRVSYKEANVEPMVYNPMKDKNYLNTRITKEIHCTADNFPSTNDSKREQFLSRVGYFNKMRNFYSKNDVKKMENILKTGCFEFLFLNSKEISSGCYSNIILQQAIKMMNEEEKCNLIKNLGSDIGPIASTKYGAYSIQSIIMSCESRETQNLLSEYFERYGEFLISHEIGNYAIQKVLRFDEELVFDLCMKNIKEIIENDLGIKVLKRCLSFFENKLDLLKCRIKDIQDSSNKDRCLGILSVIDDK